MTAEMPDAQRFMEMYRPDDRVRFEDTGAEMTLGQALQLEALLCTADTDARQDPLRRIGYLARILAAGGSLLPEHEHLLEDGS
jgi:hypothetical protein